MSLINDMLKDLENRGGRGDITDDVRTAGSAPARSAPRGLLLTLGVLVVALASAVSYLVLREAPAQPSTVATPVPVEPRSEPAGAPSVAEPVDDNVAVVATVSPPVVETSSEPKQPVTSELPEPEPAATVVEKPAPAKAEPEPVRKEAGEPLTDETQTMIVRRHEPTPAEKAARASREGFAALERQDWNTAARLLDELVAMEPANDDAREGLVVALVNQGRIAEADGVLLDGLAVGANPSRFGKLRARLLVSRGEADAALQSLAVAVPPVAEDPEFHALRGALAQQAGEYALALRTYQSLVAFAPGNGTWLAGLAMALDQAGDPVQAYEAYRRAHSTGGLEPALLDHVRLRLDTLAKKHEPKDGTQERSPE